MIGTHSIRGVNKFGDDELNDQLNEVKKTDIQELFLELFEFKINETIRKEAPAIVAKKQIQRKRSNEDLNQA